LNIKLVNQTNVILQNIFHFILLQYIVTIHIYLIKHIAISIEHVYTFVLPELQIQREISHCFETISINSIALHA